MTWDVIYDPAADGGLLGSLEAQLTAAAGAGATVLDVAGSQGILLLGFPQIPFFADLGLIISYGGFGLFDSAIGAASVLGTITVTYDEGTCSGECIWLDVVPGSVLFTNLAGPIPNTTASSLDHIVVTPEPTGLMLLGLGLAGLAFARRRIA